MINSQILNFLDEEFPTAHCELNYTKDYEFLIAVMLSAQTTDKAVNQATAILFKQYPTLNDLANANKFDIEHCIQFLGMYKAKASNVKAIAKRLLEDYGGKVPNDAEALLSLPGVGNKTKNCVLGELFNEPLLACDTHVQRVSKRLDLVNENDSVKEIEQKLVKEIPQSRIVKTNHQLIWFGRYMCKAQHPLCEKCKLHNICKLKSYLK